MSRLLSVGWGVFSTAVGIAIGLSGVDGALSTILAWVFVSLGVTLMLVGLAHKVVVRGRGARAHATGLSVLTVLMDRVAGTGQEILRFARERRTTRPSPPEQTGIRHPLRSSHARRRYQELCVNHEDDTMSLYDERFTSRVEDLVQALRERGRIGQREAHELVTPKRPGDLVWIGERLIELSQASEPHVTRLPPAA